MKLDEILDSEIENLLQATAWGWYGSFTWGDAHFAVELRKTSITHVQSNNCFEGSFYRVNERGDNAFSTADRSSDEPPVKVYGVVTNAMAYAWQHFDIDAVIFSAERRHASDDDQHAKKIHIYESIARRAWRKGGGFLHVRRTASSTEWLLSRESHDGDYWKDVITESRQETDQMVLNGYVVRSI